MGSHLGKPYMDGYPQMSSFQRDIEHVWIQSIERDMERKSSKG